MRDLALLLEEWQSIQDRIRSQPPASCVFQEPDLIERTVRDFLTADVERIVVDSAKAHERMHEMISKISRRSATKVKLYADAQPIFDRFGITRQLENTFSRQVHLKSGGYIVVDETDQIPNGGPTYNIPVYSPIASVVAAGGNSRIQTNFDGYATKYHGVEGQLIKRMSNKWMARLSASYNNATDSYENDVTTLGNPTSLDTDPIIDGGQYAPRSAGSGQGDIYVNAKWQLNMNGLYALPWDSEVAGNLFGRQGNPFPVFRQASLGLDGAQRVLISPALDDQRFGDTWNLDLRWAKRFAVDHVNARVEVDLFNVFNGNVDQQRERNAAWPNYYRLNQILSPRILRFGLRLTFK